jgi:diguanylate cyclase (GGDEF)-like protein/PAS domain S-box-containing protein
LKDSQGNIIGVLGIGRDSTVRVQAEEKLKLSARVFRNTHEGIAITDASMNIIDVNPAFIEITGYSLKEVIGQNPRILSSGQQSSEFYEDMLLHITEQDHWQGEVWNRKKSGEIYAELLSISVLKNKNDNVINYVSISTDITGRKKHQEQLSFMAHYDELTGLPNRTLFADRFHQAIAHSNRTEHLLAVCFLDLDNFKPVNDNYGHEMGDKLLNEVAERIAENTRQEDTVSRQGGDEFTLLLNDIESFTECAQTLQRINDALALPFFIDGYTHKITASIGVTLYPDDDGDIDTLLRHADQAMYKAKQEGKNRFHLFNTEHDQRTIQKQHQLGEIEQALVNNEFQLYYQPNDVVN